MDVMIVGKVACVCGCGHVGKGSAHSDKICAKLTRLTKEQADYLGVPVGGPYKPEHYRY